VATFLLLCDRRAIGISGAHVDRGQVQLAPEQGVSRIRGRSLETIDIETDPVSSRR
jgi:hypothetical protein